jgi:hypothetical protein
MLLFAKYNKINHVKEDKVARNVARMGDRRNAYRDLVGKPDGKRPIGRIARGWKE